MKSVLSHVSFQLKSKSFWIKVLFVVIAAVLWLLIKLSKSGYVTTISYPVLYENVPQNKILLSNASHTITLRISSFGFRLLGYELNKETPLKINVKSQVRKAPGKKDMYYWLPNLYTEELESQLDGQTSLLRMEPDTVYLMMSEKIKKVVPVETNVKVSFLPGFNFCTPIEANPKTVTLFGPGILLDTINSVQTKRVVLENVKADISKKVSLNFSNNRIDVSPKHVHVQADVAEFTEKKITVPIRISNVPTGHKATIIPNTATVLCKVALQDFTSITEKNVEVICDFSQLKQFPNREKLILKVNQLGTGFSIVNQPQTVDFLLFKQ